MRRAIALCLLLASCGGTPASATAHTLVPLPEERAPRAAALDMLGRALFAAMRTGNYTSLAPTDAELARLLDPEGVRIVEGTAPPSGDPLNRQRTSLAFAHSQYAGVCLQGGRDEAAGTAPFRPRARGWVVERVLVVADDLQAGRMAGWVEGTFMLTDRGFVAIMIDSAEAPRQHHADLEMGACDMEVGLDDHNR